MAHKYAYRPLRRNSRLAAALARRVQNSASYKGLSSTILFFEFHVSDNQQVDTNPGIFNETRREKLLPASERHTYDESLEAGDDASGTIVVAISVRGRVLDAEIR